MFDLNDLARSVPWVRDTLRDVDTYGALAIVSVVVLGALRAFFDLPASRPRFRAALLVPLVALPAAGAASLVAGALHHAAPAAQLRGLLVVVRPGALDGLPDARAALASAAATVLAFGGDPLPATLAALITVLGGLASVAAGTDLPSEAAAGLLFGIVFGSLVWLCLGRRVARAGRSRSVIPLGLRPQSPLSEEDAPRPVGSGLRLLSEDAPRPVQLALPGPELAPGTPSPP